MSFDLLMMLKYSLEQLQSPVQSIQDTEAFENRPVWVVAFMFEFCCSKIKIL